MLVIHAHNEIKSKFSERVGSLNEIRVAGKGDLVETKRGMEPHKHSVSPVTITNIKYKSLTHTYTYTRSHTNKISATKIGTYTLNNNE